MISSFHLVLPKVGSIASPLEPPASCRGTKQLPGIEGAHAASPCSGVGEGLRNYTAPPAGILPPRVQGLENRRERSSDTRPYRVPSWLGILPGYRRMSVARAKPKNYSAGPTVAVRRSPSGQWKRPGSM